MYTAFYGVYKKNEKGEKVAILGLGTFFGLAKKVKEELSLKLGINATLINPKFITGVDEDLLENLKQNHLQDTRIVAAKIYSSLPDELKKEVNLPRLQEAALLHDYGKVLIPKSILDKKGKLNEVEREVMELHSELGYELLKDKGLGEKTLELIKYHHQNLKGTGYPAIANNSECGLDTQILNVADKYSALREKRSYKNPLAKYEALEIIAKEVNSGEVSQDVYTALMKCV